MNLDKLRTGNLADAWDAVTTPIGYVVDEQGVNMWDAQVRHLGDRWWLYVDEADGYSVLEDDDVEQLIVVDTEPTLGYAQDGAVVDFG